MIRYIRYLLGTAKDIKKSSTFDRKENEMHQDQENSCDFNKMRTSTPRKHTSKVKRDDEEDFDPNCICYRKNDVYNCQRCHQFIEGRLTEICASHSEAIGLLDIHKCPYCQAPKSFLKISDEESMRLAEGKDVPDDSDLD